mgnify:CR=1 FL=1
MIRLSSRRLDSVSLVIEVLSASMSGYVGLLPGA